MKSISKFFAFLLILGLVGQVAKYQSANYESSDFAVSDIRTVTEACKEELVIRLPLDQCGLLDFVEISHLSSLKTEINFALKMMLG